jgi:beta-glucan synthesis-associated protein KRE6
MSAPGGSSYAPRSVPHVTINSGDANIIGNAFSQDGTNPSPPRTLTQGRSLTPQNPTSPASRPNFYGNSTTDLTDHLLDPGNRTPRDRSPAPMGSGFSSRRTSVSSDGGNRDSRFGPFASPFDDSRTPSRAGSDEESGINSQTIAEKYNINPSSGLLLFPEDVEKDDYLHNPDIIDKEKFDLWSRRGITNVGGLIAITLGVLALFIGYPVA